MTAALVMFGFWVVVSVLLVASVAPVRGRRSLDWLLGSGPVAMENGRRSAMPSATDRRRSTLGSLRVEQVSLGGPESIRLGGDRLDRSMDVPRANHPGPSVDLALPDRSDRNPTPVPDRKRPRFPVLKKRSRTAHRNRATDGETDTRDRLAVVR